MARTANILGRILRNLRKYGYDANEIRDEEIYGEMNNAQDYIISESNPDKEITVTLKEDQETYPLTTDTVTDPALYNYNNNIASVKVVRKPESFPYPFQLVTNKEFEQLINGQVNWAGICSMGGWGDSAQYIHTGIPMLGPKSGANRDFEIPHSIVQNSEEIFFNGVLQIRNTDYTIVGMGITFIHDLLPTSEDTLVCNYIEDSFFGNRLVSTRQPLVGMILNKRLQVYPIPDENYDGVEIKLMVYLKTSKTTISETQEPEVDKEYDKAIEIYVTAQFLKERDRSQLLNEFEKEAKRLRPLEQRKHHNITRPALTGWW